MGKKISDHRQEKRMSSPARNYREEYDDYHGKPEEIAYGVSFLVAEEASWITGSNLDINGGHHMGW